MATYVFVAGGGWGGFTHGLRNEVVEELILN